MSRDLVNEICRSLPGAEVSDPWGGGHDCWKVGGKMFANVGGHGDGVDVKCPDVEFARLLIETGQATRAPYMHASWVRLPFGPTAEAELRHRLRQSYALIRAGLTRRVQAGLPPLPEGDAPP